MIKVILIITFLAIASCKVESVIEVYRHGARGSRYDIYNCNSWGNMKG